MRRLGLIAALFAVLAQGLLGGVMPPARSDRLVLGAICGAMGSDPVSNRPASDPPVHEALCRLCPTCAVPDGPGLLASASGAAGPITVARAEIAVRWTAGIVVAPGVEGRPRAPPGDDSDPIAPVNLI